MTALLNDDQDHVLPALVEGDVVALTALRSEQHFTEPPPRYSEATLVKALEEFGIGRPSTYASIISTLRNREYVEVENRRFTPTDVGRVVNRFLTEFFSQYVDYEFTARMEDALDEISRGEKDAVPLLEKFWKPFIARIEDIEANVSRDQASQARVLGTLALSDRPEVLGPVGIFGVDLLGVEGLVALLVATLLATALAAFAVGYGVFRKAVIA